MIRPGRKACWDLPQSTMPSYVPWVLVARQDHAPGIRLSTCATSRTDGARVPPSKDQIGHVELLLQRCTSGRCVDSKNLHGHAPVSAPVARQALQPCEPALVSKAEHSCYATQLTSRIRPPGRHAAARARAPRHRARQTHTDAKQPDQARSARWRSNRSPAASYAPRDAG